MHHSENPREHVLPRFSLERRITVLVLLATVLVVGTIATIGIPLELLPRGFDEPSLQVQVLWQDAPAQEVLDKAVLVLEEELSTVPGLQNLFSFSTTGFGRCFMTFKIGADMDVTYREVRDRVERAKARLPDDIDRVLIRKHSEGSIPLLAMGITVDPAVTDAYNLLQNEVILPLQRIDGVADVNVRGLEEKEILIELDRERVEAAGLNVYQLGLELGGDNFTMASGHVQASGKKLLLRSMARYPDLAALENRMVGPSVRLKDVAAVRYDLPEQDFRVRAMSKPAMMLLVLKEGEANPLEVSDAIAREVERMAQNPRLELIGTQIFFSQGDTIRESLGILLDSGKIGGIFAAFVLLFFLRRFRMTAIITLSIPLSILMALVAMYFTGETLNIFTLLGLMISVGLLVDNSVVVAENIYRLHKEGMEPRQAVIRGAGEISLAIIMATLTTVIVFLPVSLVEGIGQFFLLRLAIPITVSLLASLVVALVFVPLSLYLTLPKGGDEAQGVHHLLGDRVRNALRHAYDATFERLNHGYNHVLALFLRRRFDMIVGLFVLIALSAAVPFKQVKAVPVQEEERSGFELSIVLPQSTTLEEAEAYFLKIEKKIEEMQEELDLEGYFLFHLEAYGEVSGWLNNPRQNDLSPREITERFLAAMPEKGGAKVYTGQEEDNEVEEAQQHTFVLVGDEAEKLEEVAEELEEVFAKVTGVLGVKRTGDPPAEELAIKIDRERTQRLGINPEVVAGVVRNSLGGRNLPKFYRDGRADFIAFYRKFVKIRSS